VLRILYLGDPKQPRYHELARALRKEWKVRVYNPEIPLSKQAADVEVIVDNGFIKVTREVVDAAKNVRFIQRYGTGLDHADVGYILSRGILLANTPGQFSAVALAEHALLLMLALSKNARLWEPTIRMKQYAQPCGGELRGKTLGIIGLGASGSELARIAKGLGMGVMAVDVREAPPSSKLKELGIGWFGGIDSMERLYRESDYISVHVPLTERTRGMVGKEAFGMMKKTARLINVSRGAVVDEQALLEALESGRIAGAGLDVFSSEPVEPSHPLLALENVLASPHIAGVTLETARRRAEVVSENIDRVLRGEPPLFAITSSSDF